MKGKNKEITINVLPSSLLDSGSSAVVNSPGSPSAVHGGRTRQKAAAPHSTTQQEGQGTAGLQ